MFSPRCIVWEYFDILNNPNYKETPKPSLMKMNRKTIMLSMLFLALIVPFIAVNCVAVITPGGDPHTPGYWKNHPQAWPEEAITVGGVTYTKDQAISLLSGNAKDATYKLTSHLIAAKLNAASGNYGANDPATVWNLINSADAFLIGHPLGSNPVGAERNYALNLKDSLDTFNQS